MAATRCFTFRTLFSAILTITITMACGGPIDEEGGEGARSTIGHSTTELTSSVVSAGAVHAIARREADVWYAGTQSSSGCPSRVLLRRYTPSTGASVAYSYGCNARVFSIIPTENHVFIGLTEVTTWGATTHVQLRLDPMERSWRQQQSFAARPTAMIGNGSMLYYSDARGTRATPLYGGPMWTLSSVSMNDLVSDGTNLFGASASGIYKMAINQAPVVLSTTRAARLALDANNVYWVSNGTVRVGRIPKAGGANALLYIGSGTNMLGGALTHDGSSIAWIDSNDVGGSGTLRRMPSSGGAASTVLTGLTGSFSLLPLPSNVLRARAPTLLVGDANALRRVDDDLVFAP
jgi:hypothetical protein